MIKLFSFLLLSSLLNAKTTEIFSFQSKNQKNKVESLIIKQNDNSKQLFFTLTLRKPFVVEQAMYDSIESQVQASKLQIERREKPVLNPAEYTLVSVMSSMDDNRPRSYREAYEQYQTRQHNRVMNNLENPQNYYQNSVNNNNYFEKQVKTKTKSVLIPTVILGIKDNKSEIYFKADDKYDITVESNSKQLENISYERNKEVLQFTYSPQFIPKQISLATIDDSDYMLEYLSNPKDQFDYRGAWHLLKDNKLLPFQNMDNKDIFIKK
ncbi:MAG: hypothetical protein KC646_09500 [Candidatus Cloacimonetes bacterium]|nr:hypothetical protein [Candidatus Cloacimonadota bacterium]